MVSLAPSRTMLLPALLLVSLLPQDPALLQQDLVANVWMGTGFKIGEVTGTEAVVWTRVTGSRRAVGLIGQRSAPLLFRRSTMIKRLISSKRIRNPYC